MELYLGSFALASNMEPNEQPSLCIAMTVLGSLNLAQSPHWGIV